MSAAAESSAVNVIPVRMGEMVISRDPRDVLSVIGLGSCVALILIAPKQRAAALAHVVLPESLVTGGREAPKGKFADTALPAMLESLVPFGVRAADTYAILLGGAMMFQSERASRLRAVGDRNVEAVRDQLAAHGIGIASEDVGGTAGRSVNLVVSELGVYVRSGQSEQTKMKGAGGPLRVKVSEAGADLQPEPYPEDTLPPRQLPPNR